MKYSSKMLMKMFTEAFFIPLNFPLIKIPFKNRYYLKKIYHFEHDTLFLIVYFMKTS